MRFCAMTADAICEAAAVSNCGWRCITWKGENTENFACQANRDSGNMVV